MLTPVRALLLDAPGEPGTLRLADIPSPWQQSAQQPRRTRGYLGGPAMVPASQLGERPVEVLIQVEAVGLNPVDHKLIASGHPSWAYPQIPGLDVAGRVVAVHADHKARQEFGWMIPPAGARVLLHQDLRLAGGFAEYISVSPDTLAVIPRTIDPIAAAALPTAGLAALDAVERRLRSIAGQTVLVHGASGAVGGYAVQLANLFGARVIASARPENEDTVRSLGALHVLNYCDPLFEEHVRDLAHGGVDAVIDTVSATSATASLRLLRHAGHLVAVAGRPDLRIVPPFGLAPTVSEIAIGAAYTTKDPRDRAWLKWGLERLMTLVVEGHIHPVDITVVSFEEIPDALTRMRNRKVTGKVVANLRWS
ncbi:MAG: zinc-binding dehydrogenase [Candidatus Nanopelagicales bacterium]